MADNPTMRIDQGAVNARILAREVKADFRRVEAASLKMRTRLTSAEAKRLFVRMFNTLQLNAHFITVIARTRLDHKEVEDIEAQLRAQIDAANDKVGEAIDGAEALFKYHGISSYATYDTQALEIDVGILSSSGRRYLEVLGQFDLLMPLLQTLEIHEVITTQALDIQRAALKRQIKNVATSARRLAAGLRRRMNALAAQENEAQGRRSADLLAVRDEAVAPEEGALRSSASPSQPSRRGGRLPRTADAPSIVSAGAPDLPAALLAPDEPDELDELDERGASPSVPGEAQPLDGLPGSLTDAAESNAMTSATLTSARSAAVHDELVGTAQQAQEHRAP